ncbi:MAG: VCBS repeat-containing protein [Bacteroidota bacterium]
MKQLFAAVSVPFFFVGMLSAQTSQWAFLHFSTDSGWRTDRHIRTTGDVDGDGNDDLVGFGQTGVYVSFSDGRSFGPAQKVLSNYAIGAGGWSVKENPRFMGDVNKDGKDDIIGFGTMGVYVSYSTGSGFSEPLLQLRDHFSPIKGWNARDHVRTVGDINGDGLTDLVGFFNDGVYVAFATTIGFEEPQKLLSNFAPNAGGWTVNNHPRVVADVDGDGKDDIIGFGQNAVLVSLSTGRGLAKEQPYLNNQFTANSGWSTSKHVRTTGDLNNDGKADLIGFGEGGLYVSLATEDGFLPSERLVTEFGYGQNAGSWRLDNQVRLMADVNGDGISDAIGIEKAQVLVHKDLAIIRPIAVNKLSIESANPMVTNEQLGTSSHEFVQEGLRLWVERPPSGTPVKWTELHRDNWNVYLMNKRYLVRLDLANKALYRADNAYFGTDIANMAAGLSFPISEYERQSSILLNSNDRNAYMLSWLTYAPKGQSTEIAEWSRVTVNQWKRIRYQEDAAGLGASVQAGGASAQVNLMSKSILREIRKEEWGIELKDDDGNYVRIDLQRKRISTKTEGGTYQHTYDIIESFGINESARADVVSFTGTYQSVSKKGLEVDLETQGLQLVTTKELKENQCALLYPQADAEDVSAEFGVLVCNVRINGDLNMYFQGIHGQCDASNAGPGVSCEVSTAKTEITFDKGDGEKKTYTLTGPSAGTCASVSPDRLCGSAGGSLFGMQFTDENGNSIGFSLDAGIGGGLAGSFEDGILSVEFELKFIVGGTLSLDLDLGTLVDDPKEGALNLGQFAYTVSGGFVRVAAGPIKSLVSEIFGEDVGGVINTGISLFTECPFDVLLWLFNDEDVDCLD